MGKVIILNGSPKVNGNTATALHEVELSLLDRLFYSNLHTDWSMKVGAAVSRNHGTGL